MEVLVLFFRINILLLEKERKALDSGIETSNNCSDNCSNNNNNNNCQQTTSCGQHQEVEHQYKGSCNNTNTEEETSCQPVVNLTANQGEPQYQNKSGE